MSQSFQESVLINATPEVVWETLTRVERMLEWMGELEMMIEIETNWRVGEAFVIRGFHHAHFENKGVVLAFEPHRRLAYTQLSSLSRLSDQPESYTTFEFGLERAGEGTSLTLTMSNFPTLAIFKHLQFYWAGTLSIIKQHSEQQARSGLAASSHRSPSLPLSSRSYGSAGDP